MSGGYFDYSYFGLNDISETCMYIGNNKNIKQEDIHSTETKAYFKKISKIVNHTMKIIDSTDYYLSGDIGEDTFLSNVKSEITELCQLINNNISICDNCNCEFFKTKNNHKYCSVKCRRQAQNKRYYLKKKIID